jgi:hypothetical protein
MKRKNIATFFTFIFALEGLLLAWTSNEKQIFGVRGLIAMICIMYALFIFMNFAMEDEKYVRNTRRGMGRH